MSDSGKTTCLTPRRKAAKNDKSHDYKKGYDKGNIFKSLPWPLLLPGFPPSFAPLREDRRGCAFAVPWTFCLGRCCYRFSRRPWRLCVFPAVAAKAAMAESAA